MRERKKNTKEGYNMGKGKGKVKYKVKCCKRVYRKVTDRNTKWVYVNMCVLCLIVQIEKLDSLCFDFLNSYFNVFLSFFNSSAYGLQNI